MKALTVADIIVTYFDTKGDLITNKKLQKLLYYVEAWNLVYHKSLIDDDFEAWVNGAVVPSVYREFKKFGYSAIETGYKKGETATKKLDRLFNETDISKKHKEILEGVLDKYGALASYQLESLCHSEKPWQEARKGLKPFEPSSNVIDKKVMKKYYSSLVKK